MGGDNAPRVEVEGVAQALRELPPGFLIQLVGRTADIEAALKAHGDVDRGRLQIVEAPDVVDRPEPGVGLLNVGEEDEKGNAAAKEAHQLLKQATGIHYVGNVEGRDILAGECKKGRIDVVVCDGFVGNVVLKFYESAGRMFMGMIKQAFPDVLGRPEAKRLFKFLDYSEYGGAPLLGAKGVVIICHGSSPARAIMNAVRVAAHMVESHVDQDIGAELAGGSAAR